MSMRKTRSSRVSRAEPSAEYRNVVGVVGDGEALRVHDVSPVVGAIGDDEAAVLDGVIRSGRLLGRREGTPEACSAARIWASLPVRPTNDGP